ncbi:hypothetical protein ACIQUM_07530 [Amycolatopsis azurea]|uniref:hypothetical protein n=1 Tax=Amycolatopsis azurea TaxID=36819 RepID=UPI00382053E0
MNTSTNENCRLPNLWWSPAHGLLERRARQSWRVFDGDWRSFRLRLSGGARSDPGHPADAVELGDVQALARDIRQALNIYFEADADPDATILDTLKRATDALEAAYALVPDPDDPELA